MGRGKKRREKMNLKELKKRGGTDKAVFNEKGMCILRIFMTIYVPTTLRMDCIIQGFLHVSTGTSLTTVYFENK